MTRVGTREAVWGRTAVAPPPRGLVAPQEAAAGFELCDYAAAAAAATAAA